MVDSMPFVTKFHGAQLDYERKTQFDKAKLILIQNFKMVQSISSPLPRAGVTHETLEARLHKLFGR